LKLHFFDLALTIYSDADACVDYLAQMYRRFRVDGLSPPVQTQVEITLLTAPNNWGEPVMLLDGLPWPLGNLDLLPHYVDLGVLNTIVTRIRSHLLIHAGVVSRQGQGLILAADSYHGKTTLVLELVRRGFNFLSDESAALDRADGQVHPFPRALGIRPGPLALTGLSGASSPVSPKNGKLLLDIEQLQPKSLGRAVPISHVILLQNPAGAAGGCQTRQAYTLHFDRLDKEFLAVIEQIEGITTNIQPDFNAGNPSLTLWVDVDKQYEALSHIEALCLARRIWLLDVNKGTTPPPTFERPARLQPMSHSQAILALLERFQGGYQSVILQGGPGGNSIRLFMELAALIGPARCYKLSVGALPQMADLICDLVEL